MGKQEVTCKFWIDGYSVHVDAPKSNISCIGKDSCEAWRDSGKSFSEENYRTAKELIKARAN